MAYFRKRWLSRLVAAFQVMAILIAWVAAQFPNVILMVNGNHLTFFNTVAPHSTLVSLTIALIVGVLIIIPMLAYLFFSFNKINLSKK